VVKQLMFLLDTQFADSELDRVDKQSWKRVSSLSMINVTTAWLSQDFFTIIAFPIWPRGNIFIFIS